MSASSDKELTRKKGFERLSLVWVRIKGFPVWPAVIVTMPDVPERETKVILSAIFLANPAIIGCTTKLSI
jgi:hypothetical protein